MTPMRIFTELAGGPGDGPAAPGTARQVRDIYLVRGAPESVTASTGGVNLVTTWCRAGLLRMEELQVGERPAAPLRRAGGRRVWRGWG